MHMHVARCCCSCHVCFQCTWKSIKCGKAIHILTLALNGSMRKDNKNKRSFFKHFHSHPHAQSTRRTTVKWVSRSRCECKSGRALVWVSVSESGFQHRAHAQKATCDDNCDSEQLFSWVWTFVRDGCDRSTNNCKSVCASRRALCVVPRACVWVCLLLGGSCDNILSAIA